MDKCVNKGSVVEFCGGMSNCFKKGLGDFEVKLMAKISTGETKEILTCGKARKNKVQLAYCPACGVDIRTNYDGFDNGN